MRARLAPLTILAWFLATPAVADDLASEVRSLLEARCASCHGPSRQRGGLRVDRLESLLRGGDSGEPSVIPGDGDASPLVLAVSGRHPTLSMPPTGEPLTAAEVGLLRDWIDQGGALPEADAENETSSSDDLWSLKPLRPVAPPAIDDPWVRNPIDAFVLAGLREAGLEPSSPAEPRTLVRRVSLVMHGLPPEPEEVERLAVSAEVPEDAYRGFVEEVLESPRYGERWAQHWLDVVRWAETWGFETNSPRPNAWPYRDWVIRALNDDLPYDRFVFAQLAGDTLGDDAATGLLVAGPANLPGQIGKDEESIRQARQDELDESLRTVGSAFLGLTIGCARCHSHKFDPITQRDYYAFQAIFAGLRYGDRRFRGPENDHWQEQAAEVARTQEALRGRLEEERDALGLRPALSPSYQEERFDPIEARSVRIAIRATHQGGRPSLDELEVWTSAGDGTEPVNVALADRGGRASASSFALENQTRHPDNLNDGRLSSEGYFPWIAAGAGPGWARIDLAEPATIDRVAWRRGSDGFPVDYDVEVLGPDDEWQIVADPSDRMLHEEDRRAAESIRLDGVTAEDVGRLVGLLGELRAAEAEHSRLSAGPQVFAGSFRDAGPTHLLRRGDPMQRLEVMAPDVPEVLGTLGLDAEAPEAERRVALARHLTRPDHPLTARVMVNRVWQQHFGTGLVATPSDFGRMGAPPSHPELLDWLAVEFVQHGWSVKHLHRLILTSSTFRQSSTPRDDARAIDADGRLLWRFPPRRLEAEAIRDAILRVSGTLNTEMAGPGFDFFNQKGGLSDYIPVEEFDANGRRRMIYATKIRMQAVEVFGSFDCPDAGQMTPKRTRSITPIQALSLWNSGFVNRLAAAFAERVRAESGPEVVDCVDHAVRLAFGRPPTVAEADRLTALGRDHGLEQVCRVLLNTNEFLTIP